MQIKKEEVAGLLYLGYQYAAGYMPKFTPKQRGERKKITTEGKKVINALRRKFHLMMLMAANFIAGRDLFIELGFAEEPNAKEESRAIRNFHRRMAKTIEAAGLPYKYILIREEHNRDGEPVRVHYHAIVTGTGGRMLEAVRAAWDRGSVHVQALRELSENFEDTCEYLLKESKPKGKRAYSTSRTLIRPPEPLRRKVPEGEAAEVPPGVKIYRQKSYGSQYGRYEIMMGKIVDQRQFDRYWQQAKLDRRRLEEERNWRRWAMERSRTSFEKKKKTEKTERVKDPCLARKRV